MNDLEFGTDMSAARPGSGAPERPRWYACYTRARHEKQVERLLQSRHIATYLPLLEKERQWKDRKKMVAFPVFPSYVFARFRWQDVHDVLTTPGVSTIVRANGRPVPIPDQELDNVREFVQTLADTGLQADPRPLVEEGQQVRVIDGPFRGVRGIVVERRGRHRVLVGLSAIRQGLEVDIAAELLKPIRT